MQTAYGPIIHPTDKLLQPVASSVLYAHANVLSHLHQSLCWCCAAALEKAAVVIARSRNADAHDIMKEAAEKYEEAKRQGHPFKYDERQIGMGLLLSLQHVKTIVVVLVCICCLLAHPVLSNPIMAMAVSPGMQYPRAAHYTSWHWLHTCVIAAGWLYCHSLVQVCHTHCWTLANPDV